MKRKVYLPDETAQQLRDVYAQGAAGELNRNAFVLALRHKGWPMRAIGDVFGFSRTAADHWRTDAEASPEAQRRAYALLAVEGAVPDVPVFPVTERTKRVYPQVPKAEAERMRELAPIAARLREGTPREGEVREAVAELRELFHQNVEVRGVQQMQVARETGVTRRTITQHLAKRTTGEMPPGPKSHAERQGTAA